ncbi:MAG TPA: hypothetical protein VGN24_01455 [Rhodanobacter sp.]|jgi:hypothetical protein|nr:hypothetical protein [Rhodanobacter sp.]
MRVLESVVLLVIGTVLLTFSSLSLFLLSPHPPRLDNPDLFVVALFVAGLVFAGLGIRGMYRIHRALSCGAHAGSKQAATA